jgi:hypothetical protein
MVLDARHARGGSTGERAFKTIKVSLISALAMKMSVSYVQERKYLNISFIEVCRVERTDRY